MRRRRFVQASAALLAINGLSRQSSGVSVQFNSDDLRLETDDVDEVHITPRSIVVWKGYERPVTKVRQTLEARLIPAANWPNPEREEVLTPTDDVTAATLRGWWPIYRETVDLFTRDEQDREPDFQHNGRDVWFKTPHYVRSADPGRNGHLDYLLRRKGRPDELNYYEHRPYRPTIPTVPIYIVHKFHPMPDYQELHDSNSVDLDTTYEALMNGTNIDGGQNFINGSYGTVGHTSRFDTIYSVSIIVQLRLVTTLHTDYAFLEDIDGQSPPLVASNMPSSTPRIPWTEQQTYDQIRSAHTHPAIDVQTTAFRVDVINQ